jgi:2-methylcitrate dehydratase PrpD
MSIALQLAENSSIFRNVDLPGDVVKATKERLLDYFGVALLGYRWGRHKPFLKVLVPNLECEAGATVIGEGFKIEAAKAACLNGIMSHSTTYEDGSRFAAVHPASVVIPAALAVAEQEQVNGQKLIAAMVAGYEVMIRIGTALNPSAVQRGFQPTGIVGPMGAAAAAAVIWDLNVAQIAAAIAIAADQGTGLMEAFMAPEAQPLHVGQAAAAGIIAAALAREGITGVTTIIEDAYLKAYADDFKKEAILAGLGQTFKIKDTYLKIYGGCRHIHAPIDAVKKIVSEHNLKPEAIAGIELETYSVAVNLDKHRPQDAGEAAFSAPFGIAVMLLKGDCYADRFSEKMLQQQDIKNIISKVKMKVNDEWDRVYPQKRGCLCTIKTKNGKDYECSLDFAKGEPEFPFTFEEIRDKYLRLSTPILGVEKAHHLIEMVDNLDQDVAISDLMVILKAK